MRAPSADSRYFDVKRLIHGAQPATSARRRAVPNIAECWYAAPRPSRSSATRAPAPAATATCTPAGPSTRRTRSSRCASRRPRRDGLQHVVVTSVDRDDLPERGAGHYAATIRALKRKLPEATVEVLTPYFLGLRGGGAPDRCWPRVPKFSTTTSRPSADCIGAGAARRRLRQSALAARRAKELADYQVPTKLGHGRPGRDERRGRRHDVDLREHGVDVVTIGRTSSLGEARKY